MLKRLTHNWTLKLTALILSVALWSHVRGEVNPWEVQKFKVRLTAETPNGYVMVDGDKLPRLVTVAVRGPRQTLRQLKGAPTNPLLSGDDVVLATSRQLHAGLDFSNPRKGTQKVPVKVETSWEDIEVIGSQPTEISATLDVATKRAMAIDTQFDVPEEWRAVNIKPDVPNAQVSGASNVLARVERVQAVISEKTITPGQKRFDDVPVEALDENGDVVEGVRVEPSSVSISARFTERLEEKTVPVRVSTTGEPGRGHRLADVDSRPDSVTLRGPQRLLEKISSIEISIDISGASGDVSRRVKVTVPTGVELVGLTRVRARAHIENEPTSNPKPNSEEEAAPTPAPLPAPATR